jgi:hypothetical protein
VFKRLTASNAFQQVSDQLSSVPSNQAGSKAMQRLAGHSCHKNGLFRTTDFSP